MGDLVEFTDRRYQHYPPKDTRVIRYGVAIEAENKEAGTVKVKLANGAEATAYHIYAYAWIGWIPDGLEDVYMEINKIDPYGYDDIDIE